MRGEEIKMLHPCASCLCAGVALCHSAASARGAGLSVGTHPAALPGWLLCDRVLLLCSAGSQQFREV